MKHQLFPRLWQICRSARVGDYSGRTLAPFQARAQDDLRGAFASSLKAPLAGGIVLPWSESRVGSPQAPLRFESRDRSGLKVLVENDAGDLEPETQERSLSVSGGTSGNQGGMTVATEVPEIGPLLNDVLVLPQLGCRLIGGARGDLNLPSGRVAIDCEWLSETAAAADTGELLGQLSLTPHRVTASIPVSDQLLMQQDAAEPFIRAELTAALAVAMQRAAIAGTGGTSPLGIINTAAIPVVEGGANGVAPTADHLAALEYQVTGVGKADRGHLGWLTSPAVRKKLRRTPIFDGGSQPVWREDAARSLFGYPAGVTPSVPDGLMKGVATNCSAILFGEFSELFLVTWGPGIVVTAIRDAALARDGKTLLIGTVYFDAGVRNPAAWAIMRDALAS